jgi:hypothetical protein
MQQLPDHHSLNHLELPMNAPTTATKAGLILALIQVNSSQLNALGYDADTNTLAIRFPGRGDNPGAVYHYSNVPPDVYAAFMAAESKGKFFLANIKGNANYPFQKQPDADGIAFGLPLAQEPKYTTGVRDGRICNRATGKPIPDQEPIFILRAKDALASVALSAYLAEITDADHAAAVQERIDAFDAFAEANPDLVKQPDTAAA